MMGRNDCRMTSCKEPSTDECLTKSPLLSKLKDDPVVPTVVRVLRPYGSGYCAQMNSSRVGSSGLSVVIDTFSGA